MHVGFVGIRINPRFVRISSVMDLHVEYAERRIEYGILLILSPCYQHSHLDYEHVPV